MVKVNETYSYDAKDTQVLEAWKLYGAGLACTWAAPISRRCTTDLWGGR
jgi:hypothetical protein